MRVAKSILTAACFTACLAPAIAAAQTGPLNTGYNADGTPITLGQSSDNSAWTGVDVTGGGSVALPAYAASYAADYPGAWLTPPSGTEWVTPAANSSGGATDYPSPVDHTIDWTQTFSLTSNQAASDILGVFAVDNLVTELLVNGNVVINAPGGVGNFNIFTGFDIPSSDLIADGNNTIEFVTVNSAYSAGANPTGLLVEFTQIPEPGTIPVVIAGLAALGLLSRRRPAC
jgi:hypothetical protein